MEDEDIGKRILRHAAWYLDIMWRPGKDSMHTVDAYRLLCFWEDHDPPAMPEWWGTR